MDNKHFFKIVNDVTSIWEKVKEIPEYDKKVGSLLFKTLFEKHPSIFESFPFVGEHKKKKSILRHDPSIHMQPEPEICTVKISLEQMNFMFLEEGFDYEKDPRFVKHGQRWVRMFSLAIDMLGPDLDVVEEQFMDLGERHVQYSVTSRQYRVMGKILLGTLEAVLGKKVFNEEIKESWTKFYYYISKTMSKGMERQYSSLQKSTSSRSLPSPTNSRTKPELKRAKSDKNDEKQRQFRSSAAALAGYRQKIMERRLSIQ